jgi:hypothetical protein
MHRSAPLWLKRRTICAAQLHHGKRDARYAPLSTSAPPWLKRRTGRNTSDQHHSNLHTHTITHYHTHSLTGVTAPSYRCSASSKTLSSTGALARDPQCGGLGSQTDLSTSHSIMWCPSTAHRSNFTAAEGCQSTRHSTLCSTCRWFRPGAQQATCRAPDGTSVCRAAFTRPTLRVWTRTRAGRSVPHLLTEGSTAGMTGSFDGLDRPRPLWARSRCGAMGPWYCQGLRWRLRTTTRSHRTCTADPLLLLHAFFTSLAA